MSLSVTIKDSLRSLSNLHRQGTKPNIALFATPRGGSTWVMELLAAQHGMKFYDEPLNLRRENVARTELFRSWDELMPESPDKTKILDYISALGRGEYGILNPAPFQKNYRFFTNRIVYKIHAIEHMMNDVRDACNCWVVYLLRHPISNTLSRTVFPRLEYFLNSSYYMEGLLTSEQAKEVRRIAKTGSHMQRGIVSWCFENLHAFREKDRRFWTVLTYEELIERPVEVIRTVGKNLQFTDFERTTARVDKPSTNVKMSDEKTQEIIAQGCGENRKKYLVSRWRNRVSASEELGYFSIIDVFGIDYYELGNDQANEKYLLCRSEN